jgi:hypothetical protein
LSRRFLSSWLGTGRVRTRPDSRRDRDDEQAVRNRRRRRDWRLRHLACRKAGSHRVAPRDEPVWTEGKWPFPIDQWGEGWAFECKGVDCGTNVSFYLRPKIGFCNCQTGVADDEELDRVSDADLIGRERTALGPRRPITVHWMKGRSRGYNVGASSAKSVLSLAFNNRCDVSVATVLADDKAVAQEHKFLNGDMMRQWAEAVRGL